MNLYAAEIHAIERKIYIELEGGGPGSGRYAKGSGQPKLLKQTGTKFFYDTPLVTSEKRAMLLAKYGYKYHSSLKSTDIWRHEGLGKTDNKYRVTIKDNGDYQLGEGDNKKTGYKAAQLEQHLAERHPVTAQKLGHVGGTTPAAVTKEPVKTTQAEDTAIKMHYALVDNGYKHVGLAPSGKKTYTKTHLDDSKTEVNVTKDGKYSIYNNTHYDSMGDKEGDHQQLLKEDLGNLEKQVSKAIGFSDKSSTSTDGMKALIAKKMGENAEAHGYTKNSISDDRAHVYNKTHTDGSKSTLIVNTQTGAYVHNTDSGTKSASGTGFQQQNLALANDNIKHQGKAAPATPSVASYPTPGLTEKDVMYKKVGGQKGSNEGGEYEAKDGQQNYVKMYKSAGQAHGEQLANTLYSDLGISAPSSKLFDNEGKQAFASDIITNAKTLQEHGVTKESAQEVMKGFAADVLTGNWDVVGLHNDNILMKKSLVTPGKTYPIRIDNGSAFLYRAQGTKKPVETLDKIDEWTGYFSTSKNAEYAAIAGAAGYKNASDIPNIKDQVKAIVDTEKSYGGWSKYLDKKAPYLSPEDHKQISEMLTARTAKMATLVGLKSSTSSPVTNVPAEIHKTLVDNDFQHHPVNSNSSYDTYKKLHTDGTTTNATITPLSSTLTNGNEYKSGTTHEDLKKNIEKDAQEHSPSSVKQSTPEEVLAKHGYVKNGHGVLGGDYGHPNSLDGIDLSPKDNKFTQYDKTTGEVLQEDHVKNLESVLHYGDPTKGASKDELDDLLDTINQTGMPKSKKEVLSDKLVSHGFVESPIGIKHTHPDGTQVNVYNDGSFMHYAKNAGPQTSGTTPETLDALLVKHGHTTASPVATPAAPGTSNADKNAAAIEKVANKHGFTKTGKSGTGKDLYTKQASGEKLSHDPTTDSWHHQIPNSRTGVPTVAKGYDANNLEDQLKFADNYQKEQAKNKVAFKPLHEFTQEALHSKAKELLAKYPKGPLSQMDNSALNDWSNEFAKSQVKDAAASIKAAEGKGLYPELLAHFGMKASDLSVMKSSISAWNGSSQPSLRALFSAAVNNEPGADRGIMLEHAVTTAKLLKRSPKGTIQLFRGMRHSNDATYKGQLTFLKGMAYASEGASVGIHDFQLPSVGLKSGGAESWTQTYKTASTKFSDSNGVVIVNETPVNHVISSHQTNPNLGWYSSTEDEFIVAPPNKTYQFSDKTTKIKHGGKDSMDASAVELTVLKNLLLGKLNIPGITYNKATNIITLDLGKFDPDWMDHNKSKTEVQANAIIRKLLAGGPGSGRHEGFGNPLGALEKKAAYLAKLREKASAERKALHEQGKSIRGKEIVSEKAKKAFAFKRVSDKSVQDKGEEAEHLIAKHTKGEKQADNNPFDVVAKDSKGRKHGIEVKAVVTQQNDKITMKKEALDRKAAFAKKNKLHKQHTVVVDYRGKTPVVYYKEGVGSFRIGSMDKVKGGLKGLAAHMGLK